MWLATPRITEEKIDKTYIYMVYNTDQPLIVKSRDCYPFMTTVDLVIFAIFYFSQISRGGQIR